MKNASNPKTTSEGQPTAKRTQKQPARGVAAPTRKPKMRAGLPVTLGNPGTGEMKIGPCPYPPGKVSVTTIFPSDVLLEGELLRRKKLWHTQNGMPCPEYRAVENLYALLNNPQVAPEEITLAKELAGQLVAEAARTLDTVSMGRLQRSLQALKERHTEESKITKLRDCARVLAMKLKRFPTKLELKESTPLRAKLDKEWDKGQFSRDLKAAGLSFLPEDHAAKGRRRR